MSLAVMLSTDEDLFICDMAETYHILDYRALPLKLVATLASGLREDSRIKMKLAGFNYIPAEVVLPRMADDIMLILRTLTGNKKDVQFISDVMFGKTEKKDRTLKFASGEEFTKAWKRLTGDNNG